MLQVFSQSHERICLLKGYKELKIKEILANGDKELSFQYPRNANGAEYLKNENYIQTPDDEYVIKEVRGGAKWRKYTAKLNLEELEGKSFATFETVEKTVKECLTIAFEGTGWSIEGCDLAKKRTIRKDSVCTVLDIVEQCSSTYNIEIEYRSREKKVVIYEHRGSDKGVYFMEKLNLRKPPMYTLTSNGLYTQIRPIGKDGLKIDVDGKDYIENHAYSPKNIMLTWKDERYTLASSLLEDAMLKLEEICRPTATYEADVIDLAAHSEKHKDVLQYDTGDVVMMISTTEGVKEKMRIAVIEKYPEEPQKNKCQLSTAKKTFGDIQKKTVEKAVQEATGQAASQLKSTEEKNDTTLEEINAKIEEIDEQLQGLSEKPSKIEIEGMISAGLAESKKYTDEKLEDFSTREEQDEKIENAVEKMKMELMEEIERLAQEIEEIKSGESAGTEET